MTMGGLPFSFLAKGGSVLRFSLSPRAVFDCRVADKVSTSENVQLPSHNRLSSPHQRYGSRPPDLFTGATRTRCAIRWQVLHWRAHHANLLPPDLPLAYLAGKQCSLLSQRSRCGRSRLSSLFALPPRVFAGNPRVGRNSQHDFASVAIDQRRWIGRRRRGGSFGTPRYRLAASSPPVPAPPGSHAQRRCANRPVALRQEADRRNKFAHDAGRAFVGVRLCPAIQRSDSQRLSSNPNANPCPGAAHSRPAKESIP